MTAYNTDGSREYFRRNFAPFNILTEMENNYINLKMTDVRFQTDLSYKFAKHFSYDFLGAVRFVKSTRENIVSEKSNMANAYRAADNATMAAANRFLYTDPSDPDQSPQIVLPYGGFYNRSEDQLSFYNIRNNVKYTNTFGKHYLTILAGQEVKFTDRQTSNNTGYGFRYDQGGTVFVDYRILKKTIEQNFPYYANKTEFARFVGFYGSVGYSFDKKYNLNIAARQDGSNRFGETAVARWLPTWTLSGSWNIDQEQFTQGLKWLSYAKLRGSYGLSGDMGPATSAAVLLKNATTDRPYTNEKEAAILLMAVENKELSWEQLYSGNLGLDFGLFNNRMDVSIDVYSRKSLDLIDKIKTSGIGGQIFKYANYADMRSKGIELMLSGSVVKTKNFTWRPTLTIAYAKTEITHVDNIPNIFDMVKAEGTNFQGYPARSLFSIDFNALDHRTGVPLFTDEKGKSSMNVDMQDINTAHLVYEGPVDPPLTGGLNNTFTYKNFTFSALVTFQAGNKIRLYPVFKSNYTDFDALPKEFYDRWMQSGEEHTTSVPVISDMLELNNLSGSYPYNDYNYSTQRVAKGDFARLKSVSVGYQLPQTFLKRMGITNAGFQLTAINPLLIFSDSKLHGQDPEFFNAGGVAQPLQKQYVMSIKLTL
jgi:hypothetical protein